MKHPNIYTCINEAEEGARGAQQTRRGGGGRGKGQRRERERNDESYFGVVPIMGSSRETDNPLGEM